MTKPDYLNELKNELYKNGVEDAEEIVAEYEQHFLFKLADGFSEEEIAAKLGAPEQIAAQFVGIGVETKRNNGKKVFVSIWLTLLGVLEGLLYLMFFGFVLVLFAAAIAGAAIGTAYIGAFNIYGLLPAMPYGGALVLGLSMLALAVLFGVAALYCFALLRQTIRASLRWRKNLISGEALPPLPLNPQFSSKTRRAIRGVFRWAMLVFGVTFVLGYAILGFFTHAWEFWHALGWFGYAAG